MKRIGIDATAVALSHKGIARYQRNILLAMQAAQTPDRYYVFHHEDLGDEFLRSEQWQYVKVPRWNQMIWEQIQLPLLARRLRLDALHTSYDRIPFFCPVPVVLYLFEIPEHRIRAAKQKSGGRRGYQRWSDFYTTMIFPYTLRRCASILTGSEFTRKDLMERFRVPESKIRVVYAAQEPFFQPAAGPEEIARIRQKVAGGAPYVLHFSTGDPRDNTEVVLKAFESFKSRGAGGAKLVIVGAGSEPAHEVIFRPFVSERELLELYQGASLYVDPSLFEGFGFQPLEAMACGVPVLASNNTSIPEVIGDAGVLLDPCDVEGFSREMADLMESGARRDELRNKGLQRAARFSWHNTARAVLESCQKPENLKP